ncbi:hypothetical protein NQ317_002324 [Molorchus minor]|uniref:Uncharacterized protein n=1 Tax=Molorchus minor TaxID=1323400 RepID=A0ABQ9J3N5_9CUCU|nr:hypothetical protein NQ317_002324 [Molorchus minor]
MLQMAISYGVDSQPGLHHMFQTFGSEEFLNLTFGHVNLLCITTNLKIFILKCLVVLYSFISVLWTKK